MLLCYYNMMIRRRGLVNGINYEYKKHIQTKRKSTR
nr:MAG TPA: hypothetical protein [Caudoviricetes sp.]